MAGRVDRAGAFADGRAAGDGVALPGACLVAGLGVAGCRDVGAGACRVAGGSASDGSRITRGAIRTPARSSAGPSGAGSGVEDSGSEKSLGTPGCEVDRDCAAKGVTKGAGQPAPVSPVPSRPSATMPNANARTLRAACKRRDPGARRGRGGWVSMIVRIGRTGGGNGRWALGARGRNMKPAAFHIRLRSLHSNRLASPRNSRQQRGMDTTPGDPAQPAFLGRATPLPASPAEATLDYVPNPRAGALYCVRFAAPEFTSLCPVTGQPDFAHLVIDYAPRETIVESKSLKLFLGSFRNHGGFHEDVTVGIGQRLADEMHPEWLRIGGYWYPRGGIPIDVFWQTCAAPEGLWVPPQDVPAYRGRG